MAEVDKMTAIGELAAGVAHEFNNVLAIINSAVELISLKHATGQYDMPDDVVEAISTVQSNVYRGADIASNLMTIAKPQEPNKRAYEITKIIDDVIKVQKQQFEIEKIKVIKRYQENIPMIAVDRSQMYQLFLNLSINARHALHNRDEAQLIIDVKQNGNSIEIKFIDNGIGIKEEHLDKIFLPFFTTKGSYATDDSQIKGTGLGLAVSKSIVNSHSGSITVDSKYKEGSTFTITLPIENISNEIYFNDQKQSAVKRTFNNQINIVIVDDEKDLVDNVSEYLKSMGYNNIYSFTKGKEALSFIKENNVNLIILDIIMPEISDELLYKTIKEMNKQCKIIFSSGNLDKIQSFNYKDNDIVEYIKKPFDFNHLIKTIDEVSLLFK